MCHAHSCSSATRTPVDLRLDEPSVALLDGQIIRLINNKGPKATALVFKTGKVVVTGARSNAAVDYACKTFARILEKLDDDRPGGSSHKISFE